MNETELLARVERLEKDNAALKQALSVRTLFLAVWAILLAGLAGIGAAVKFATPAVTSRTDLAARSIAVKSASGDDALSLDMGTRSGLRITQGGGERIWLGTDEQGAAHLAISGQTTAGVALHAPKVGPGDVEAGRYAFIDEYGHEKAALRLDDQGRLVLDRLDEKGDVADSKRIDE